MSFKPVLNDKRFYYSQENIKYPTFNIKEIEDQLKIDKPITIDFLKENFPILLLNFEKLINNYENLIIENNNNFNEFLLSYNKKSYEYYIKMKCVIYIISIYYEKLIKNQIYKKYVL